MVGLAQRIIYVRSKQCNEISCVKHLFWVTINVLKNLKTLLNNIINKIFNR